MIEEVKENITYHRQDLYQMKIMLDELIGFGESYHYEDIVNKKAINIIKEHLQILNVELEREFDKLIDNPEGYRERYLEK